MDGTTLQAITSTSAYQQVFFLQPRARAVMLTVTVAGGALAHLRLDTSSMPGGEMLPMLEDTDFDTPSVDKINGIIGPLDAAGAKIASTPIHQAPDASRFQFRIPAGPAEIRLLAKKSSGNSPTLTVEYSY